jgi:carbamoyl-phosphate synthase large subunit
MIKKINVLVDGVGGDVGQGIIKCLRDSKLNLNIHAACIFSTSAWLYHTEYSCVFPPASSPDFEEFLINYIISNEIHVYFPSVDQAIMKISILRENIEKNTNCIVFVDSPEKINICEDKYKTIQYLEQNGFDHPKTCEVVCSIEVESFVTSNPFPLILKPKSGNGSKGVFIVNCMDDLSSYIGDSSLMLQEFLDIKFEITSGIYLGDDSEIKGIYVLKRTLKNGSTFHAERIVDDVLNDKLIKIAKNIGMKYINIQATYKNSELKPFEFNGRMSGTTGAMRSVFNAPDLYIKERFLKEKIIKSSNNDVFFFTRFNEELMYTKEEMLLLEERSNRYD